MKEPRTASLDRANLFKNLESQMDLPTIQIPQYAISTAAGVMGGFMTLGCKFLIDHLMERQKIELSLAAKRREKYYEKQTSVLAGTYERLSRCLAPTLLTYARNEKHSEPLVTMINEATAEAYRATREFESYYRDNVIYIPKEMARRIEHLDLRLSSMVTGRRMFPINTDTEHSQEELDAYRRHEKITRILFDRLRDEFREFMVNGVVKPASDDDHIDPATVDLS